jgi:hypothetical protein
VVTSRGDQAGGVEGPVLMQPEREHDRADDGYSFVAARLELNMSKAYFQLPSAWRL